MTKFFTILTFFIIFFSLILTKIALTNNNQQNEWGTHSEDITILSIEEILEVVNKKSALLIDVWKKDKKPDVIDKKKWLPPRRYSIPGALWFPNVGKETLTIEQRKYLETGLEKITKNDKNKKIIFFCRRGYYSKIAAERAVKLGYKNVFLFPGTDLWEDGGQRLVVVKEQLF